MKIITLDSINSTNDFLKHYSKSADIENFTVVVAREQTQGRGQMGNQWISEKHKNLTFSILLKNFIRPNTPLFILNLIISNALIHFFKTIDIQTVTIKWPNDIMIGNKKTSGILIENLYKENGLVDSIIGIGLNVNQTHFNQLPYATSLEIEKKHSFDLNDILNDLLQVIEKDISTFTESKIIDYLTQYNQLLYKKDLPSVFKNQNGEKFMGIIKQVSIDGKIHILLENDQEVIFNNKEIEYLQN